MNNFSIDDDGNLFSFSIDDDGNVRIPRDILTFEINKLVVKKNNLFKQLANHSIYVYANKYTLWITKKKEGANGKLLFQMKPEEKAEEIVIKLGRYLPYMFQRKEGKYFSAISGESLHFLFERKYCKTGFLRMYANGEVYGLSDLVDISSGNIIGGVTEYKFKNGIKVNLPYLLENTSSAVSKNSSRASITLNSESIEAINDLLDRPLEDDDYLYLRTIVEPDKPGIYLLPVTVFRAEELIKEKREGNTENNQILPLNKKRHVRTRTITPSSK